DRRELASDVAAADDDEPAREAREVEDLVRADRALAAGDVGRHRPAAGRDDDALGAMARARDLDLAASGDPRTTAHDRRAGALDELAIDVVQARDLDAAVGLERLPVERRRFADAPAEARRFVEALVVVRGEAVQLLRDAADVDASAAERGVLGDGDACAALRSWRAAPRRASPAACTRTAPAPPRRRAGVARDDRRRRRRPGRSGRWS